ncbi:MAG: hypothetical protein QOD98_2768 [Nocardioidaceae bacterium]|jgi:hypothetical protein|nr:hypothetical protein [Nocardioidaceae bacterium]
MQFRKLADNRLVTILAGATVIALIGAGAGYSAGLITSADIKDHTIKLKDIRPGTVKKLKGQTGPTGPQGPAGPSGTGETVVSALGSTLPWDATNPSVSLTPDGVEFGPYADAGLTGGSVCWKGMNGQHVSAVKSISYNVRYRATANGQFAAPYLRLFLNDGTPSPAGDHDIIFSANTQSPDPDLDEGEFNEYVVTQGSVRYDDDGGSLPDQPWLTVKAAHGTNTISDDICITQGFAGGSNADALLRWVEVNGTKYVFRGN